ncbi:hypothetical protein GQ53DRAFT_329016 [Thozetella sp. PMI_491]|nr:hypothetical protein GQ53DRAFT_329016 [Thozetella sp. PMI_491]
MRLGVAKRAARWPNHRASPRPSVPTFESGPISTIHSLQRPYLVVNLSRPYTCSSGDRKGGGLLVWPPRRGSDRGRREAMAVSYLRSTQCDARVGPLGRMPVCPAVALSPLLFATLRALRGTIFRPWCAPCSCTRQFLAFHPDALRYTSGIEGATVCSYNLAVSKEAVITTPGATLRDARPMDTRWLEATVLGPISSVYSGCLGRRG